MNTLSQRALESECNILLKPSFEQYNELIHVVAQVQLTMVNNIHSLTI